MKTKKTLTLSPAIQRMLHTAVKSHGFEDVLMFLTESLTGDEYESIEAFLQWLKDNKRSFGWNIAEVVVDWEKDQ